MYVLSRHVNENDDCTLSWEIFGLLYGLFLKVDKMDK